MNYLKLCFTGIFALMLASCGGGGSSSGGGGGGSDSIIFFATGTFAVSAAGGTIKGPIRLTITVTGKSVFITDGGDSGSAPLSADGKNFTVPFHLKSDPSVTCNAPVIISGTIAGTSISGTLSGSATCTNSSGTGPVRFSGTFSGTQSSTAKSVGGPGIGKLISSVIP